MRLRAGGLHPVGIDDRDVLATADVWFPIEVPTSEADAAREILASTEPTTEGQYRRRRRPGPTCGILAIVCSILAILGSFLFFITTAGDGFAGTATGLGAIGLGVIGCLVGFLIAFIGLLRFEEPFWPAAVGALLCASPPLILFVMLSL